MPVTRSEMMFFAAGAALGAAAGANFPFLKEKFGPILAAALAGASSAVGDSYADLAKNCRREGRSRSGCHGRDEGNRREPRDDRSSRRFELVGRSARIGIAPHRCAVRRLITKPGFRDPTHSATKSTHGPRHPFSSPGTNSPGEPLPVRGAWRTELPSVRRTRIPGARDHPGHDPQSGRLERGSARGAGFLSANLHAPAGRRARQRLAESPQGFLPRRSSIQRPCRLQRPRAFQWHAHTNGHVSKNGDRGHRARNSARAARRFHHVGHPGP